MKVLIIGGVAAGTKTAAKLKRADQSADITLITNSNDISYAGCGLPYYIGGVIETEEQLIVNTPAKFAALTGVNVVTGCEATGLDVQGKKVMVKNRDGSTGEMEYDRLVIATGASAALPPVTGVDKKGVFTMRTPEDAVAIRSYVKATGAKKAVVIGGGFIGLEAAENLQRQGLSVTVIDIASQLLPNVFDPEMADYIRRHLVKAGIRVLCGVGAKDILGGDKVDSVKTDAGVLSADIVIAAAGIRPNTAFLRDTGVEMAKNGALLVNDRMETSLPDVYAAGDCAVVHNRLTGARQWSPMGSSANLEGRTLAQIIAGADKHYAGVLGTGIVALPGLNCGRTGLSEAAAREAGYDVITAVSVADDKPSYYPGASFLITKMIADRNTHMVLGVQCIGGGAGVDKVVDIGVMAISMKAKLEDIENGDFAYAPPFSTAIHPFVLAAYVLMNKLNGDMVSMTPAEYLAGKAEGYRVIDASPVPSIHGATVVDYTTMTGPIEGIGTDEKLLLVCARGKRAYLTQNKMRAFGYNNTVVLEGSTFVNEVRVQSTAAVTEEEKKAVKALGFLFDKNTPDRFNCRVITRNGKITAEESRVVAEAASIYGSGEIAMTTRLTVEIQGVPYANIEPLRAFLAEAGLETGGTGSKVRPVVSCKGTTCQYGLIDTFSLSEEIHERFFEGYSGVKLPHKFKIAVGGCPNNCVKPDLNDLGIIGQRVPQVDYEKCRGCKVCQIVNNCPIKAASVVDGKIVINQDVCNHCGRCINKCPFKCFTNYTNGYRIYIGGRWGKRVAQGRYLDKVFTDRDEVLNIVEKAILLFRDQGITGERFSDTVARLGFENVQQQLLSDDLLAHKEENLAAQKHLVGGATC